MSLLLLFRPDTATTPISDSDTGSGADALSSLVVTLSASDTGSGTEGASLLVTTSSSDTGSGTEGAALAVTTSSSDTGSGTDGTSIAATLSSSDTGSSVDAGSVVISGGTTAVADSDSASASEGASLAVSASEAATAADAGAVGPLARETGAFIEGTSLAATLSASEAGTLLDAALIGIAASDTGSGADAGAATRILSDADTASVTDAVKIKAFSDLDSGTFTDARFTSITQSGQFFTSPTKAEHYKFQGRVTRIQNMGLTVLKTAGAYSIVEDPTAEQVGAADIAYLGGRDYLITDAELAALTTAGYGAYITTKVIPG